MIIFETPTEKVVKSKDYNYQFNKKTGFFMRWGKMKKDDPSFSPWGPEIADIEITTKCSGVNGKLCSFCYKSNTPDGKNMSFQTFKKMIDKFPTYKQKKLTVKNDDKVFSVFIPTEDDFNKIIGKIDKTKIIKEEEVDVHFLTQVAFGADSKAESNPDLWKMMDYCREKEIIPNITVAQITDKTADKLVARCGAVAISRYEDKNICYDAVQNLNKAMLRQKILVRKKKSPKLLKK